ncbi:Serine/threonine-protein kinase Nek1 [Anabarilius grahami]|uniref:non-specific serine/threonine protein kinase n=1 Tax=Anabarilius grahami TaxID=495550 RepID=A0A3N0Z4S4_ANAGA|nr:Serine/threonine-protein kinase Nek1 [Anabarilius grahami]
MAQYHRLSDTSADSSISDPNMNVSPGVIKMLKEHGYTMKEELGRGASGIAFLVEDGDGDLYVVKQMNSRDGVELDTVKTEVEILKTLNFGYIVTYVNSFEDKEAGRIYIVMENCEGGDLSKIMETQKEEGFFEEKQILDWLVQICLALKYLHEKKIIHRDIKPQNVFLTEDGYVNLGDFGCSTALKRADEYANSVVGAKLYVSPEVYERKYNSKRESANMKPKDWLNLDEEKGEEGRSGLATTTQSQYRVMKQALFRAGPAVMIAQERGRLGSITLVSQSNNLCSLSRCTKLPQEQIVSDHILLQTHWDYSGEMASAVLLPGSGSFITADESSLSAVGSGVTSIPG